MWLRSVYVDDFGVVRVIDLTAALLVTLGCRRGWTACWRLMETRAGSVPARPVDAVSHGLALEGPACLAGKADTVTFGNRNEAALTSVTGAPGRLAFLCSQSLFLRLLGTPHEVRRSGLGGPREHGGPRPGRPLVESPAGTPPVHLCCLPAQEAASRGRSPRPAD